MEAMVWLDAEMVSLPNAQASVLAHSMQRGSLVFDVGAVRPSRAGAGRPLLFRPRDHIARFLRSAALVGLRARFNEDELFRATLEVVRARGVESALVRWSAFVPTIEADVVPRTHACAQVAIAVLTREDMVPPGQTPLARPDAIRVTIPSDTRKAGPEVFPPQAKVAASYLGPMLAKQRALAAGFDEVVLLDREGYVAEAPTANVFAVRGGALWTPPLDRVLAGITRDSVLAIARAEGMETREERFGADALRGADEAFLVATSLPVQPIGSVDGQALRGGAPGPVTERVRAAIAACEGGGDARFEAWVVPVEPAARV